MGSILYRVHYPLEESIVDVRVTDVGEWLESILGEQHVD